MSLQNLVARLDARADVRGHQFERICVWYLRNAPEYRSQIASVWLWDDWPGRWGIDAGIDIVVEQFDGRLWAVQAKCYDSQYSVTKHDVDSFLSESNRSEFSYRLLIATTDHVGGTARRTIAAQDKPAGLLLRSQLDEAWVEWPALPDELAPMPVVVPLRPLPHQVEAIGAVCRGFETADRGQLLMACGTGKTFISLRVAERLKSELTVVFVPSLSLLSQMVRMWTAHNSNPFRFLPVCSDITVGTDGFVSDRSELGMPATTDVSEIVAFLTGGEPGERRVVFCTYQSSPKLAEAQALCSVVFDLAVADEAHRCSGPTSNDFATVLTGSIAARRRLFMTATPRYFTGQIIREAREIDIEVASMDNTDVFGPVFHRLPFGQAIAKGLLADYRVTVVAVDNSTYADLVRERAYVTTDGKRITDASVLASEIALARAMKTFDLRRVISFHGRVRAAKAFSSSMCDFLEWLPADQRPEGAFWSEHVSGEMSSGERDRRLHRFRTLPKSERGLITNARCLAEGVDVPAIDGVAFIDPKSSQIDIIQAVGRAIRKSDGKTLGTIVIPVFIDPDEDPAAVLRTSAFRTIWGVLQALRAHDDLIGEELDELRRAVGRTGHAVGHPRKLTLDLPVHVGEEFIRAFELKLVEQTTETWNLWFGRLQEYVTRHSTSRVQHQCIQDGNYLGAWVARQRTLVRTGQLDTEKTELLQALPGWTVDEFATRWSESIASLNSYIVREGHASVPKDHVEDGYPLGSWAAVQRIAFNKGTLAPERVQELSAVRGWTWDPTEAKWENRFEVLLEYVKQHGDSLVPQDALIRGVNLGSWVSEQRGARRRGTLTESRGQRLEAVPGWEWDAMNSRWEAGFTSLERYAERHGQARPPSNEVDQNGFRLGDWVVGQRVDYNRGRVTAERAARLANLPEWVWRGKRTPAHSPQQAPGPRVLYSSYTHAEREDIALTEIQGFIAEVGHARVPVEHRQNGFALGRWVVQCRQKYRNGLLDSDLVVRLDALPGWVWNAKEADWDRAYQLLQQYVERAGDARAAKGELEEGFALGEWIKGQRQLHRVGNMPPDHELRLTATTGWVWSEREASWEDHYAMLLVFVEREQHANVPVAHVEGDRNLGSWAHAQRKAMRRQEMLEPRARRLDALPSWRW